MFVRFLPIKCSTERLQQSFSRQDAKTAKKNIFLFLRTWRPLRLAPWNILSTEALSFHSRHYFTGRVPWNILSTEALSFHSQHYSTGRVPWNTYSTKIELFTQSAIPQGSPRGVLISTQAEYDSQGVTPRGKSSFIRFRNPKFNRKFQICLASFFKAKHHDPAV